MELNIRSVVLFVVLFVIAYTNCTKVIPVSRRINGVVTAVSETYIFTTVFGTGCNNSLVVAYQKKGKSFDPHDSTDIVSTDRQHNGFFG